MVRSTALIQVSAAMYLAQFAHIPTSPGSSFWSNAQAAFCASMRQASTWILSSASGWLIPWWLPIGLSPKTFRSTA